MIKISNGLHGSQKVSLGVPDLPSIDPILFGTRIRCFGKPICDVDAVYGGFQQEFELPCVRSFPAEQSLSAYPCTLVSIDFRQGGLHVDSISILSSLVRFIRFHQPCTCSKCRVVVGYPIFAGSFDGCRFLCAGQSPSEDLHPRY